LTEEKNIALYFYGLLQETSNPKALANLFINKIKPYLAEKNIEIQDFPIQNSNIENFIALITSGKVSSAIAYQRIFPIWIENPTQTPEQIAIELDLIQNTDEDFITTVCKEVIAAFPEKVAEYKKGKKGLIGFFMGEVMKRSKGQAEPKSATALLNKMLAE
jgi:aspartyl-tRNA(Asn)/glutamyl-tRNA(Gln) amidotransferase subunit B